MAKSTLQRLVDSGLQISEMSREQAESVVRQLVKAGEVQRRDADELAGKLIDLGRETTFRLAEQVEAELVRQIRKLAERVDDLEDRLETATGQLREILAASPNGELDTTSKKGSHPAGERKSAKKSSKKGAARKRSKEGQSAGKKADQRSKSKKSKDESDGGGDEPAPPAPSVGASGVRRITTTRAARDAG